MKYFPETQRAFADGELALTMNRYGGLLDISVINVLHTPERDFPDNSSIRLFSRSAMRTIGRPLSGPAVKLLTECRDERVLHHTVLYPVIHPWGVEGDYLDMAIDDSRILCHAKPIADDQEVLRIVISRSHLHSGDFRCYKNQRVDDGCKDHCRRAGVAWNPDWPLKNGTGTLTWSAPVFLPAERLLYLEGTLHFPYGDEKLYVAFSAGVPLLFEEDDNNWVLTGRWADAPADGIDAVMAVAPTLASARKKCHLEDSVGGIIRRKSAEDQRRRSAATRIDMPQIPFVSDFTKMSVEYQHSLLLKSAPAVRAAQFKYACFMIWDTLYPIRDYLWHGDFLAAKALFRSFLGYPWIENSGWCVSHILLILEEILSFQWDEALLQEAMPYLRSYLDFQLKLTNRQTGLLVSCMNVGVDVPGELGLQGLYYAPCINGWWYGALRFMENIAIRTQDSELEETVVPIIRKIEENYLPVFLAPNGALRSGVPESREPAAIEAFQNTSTIALDYPYGQYLLRTALPQLEHYHSCRLRHPTGYTALAWDSQVRCEPWKDVHMNQHLGHEMRLARMTGHAEEVRRVMDEALEMTQMYETAIETINCSGCTGNETMTSDWQLFACTALNEAIRAGLAGLLRHAGGLRYLPIQDDREVRVETIRWKDAVISLTITGKGRYLSPMEVNDAVCPGTAQLPVDLLTPSTHWVVRRSDEVPPYPVLLQACGAEIAQVGVSGGRLSFQCVNAGHFPMQFLGERECGVMVNGEKVATTQGGWCDLHVKQGDRLSVEFL